MTEYVVLVVRNAPLGREVRGDPRSRCDIRVQTHQIRVTFAEPRHRFGKCIEQSRDELKRRKIGVSEPRVDQKFGAARIPLEHPFEITEVFRQAFPDQVMGPPFRFALLVFVIEAGRDRVMAVMNFGNEIGDGELKLMRPQSTRDRRGCEAMPFAEKQQDIRRLRDDELPAFRNGGANGGRASCSSSRHASIASSPSSARATST